MTTLTCMRGYSGSGKTTLARSYADSGSKAVIVGRDFIRDMLFDQFYGMCKPDNEREEMVTTAQQAQVRALLKSGVNVIVDDTNLAARYLKVFAKIASETGADFNIQDMRTPLVECIRRDDMRRNVGRRYVGEEVIRRQAKRFPMDKWPKVEDIRVQPIVVEPYEPPDYLLPACIIVDIDGTLAHMTGRSPYDYSRVGTDVVDPVVKRVVNEHFDSLEYTVFIVSGRDDTCREETAKWLAVNDISYDRLLMRPTDAVDSNGQKLPDWIVKLNLFNQHIRGQYAPHFVMDDRNQVVEMWRKLGLKVFQVAEGDF